LLSLRLSQIDEDRLTAWFLAESRRSKHQATRALMMFRGFLRWCSIQPEYRRLVSTEVAKGAAIMDNLPETKPDDALEAAQVSSWWTAVEQLPNQVASAYLRALLLTGARRRRWLRSSGRTWTSAGRRSPSPTRLAIRGRSR
jgi:hypothetical protein